MMKSPPSTSEEFTTVHILVFSDTQRCCVVCYKEGRRDFRVRSYCNAPQCQKCMHVSKGWDCFAVFHSKKYHRQILLMFIPMFSDVVFLKNIRKKKKTFFTLLLLSLSMGIVVIWSLFSQGGLSLVSRDVKRQIHSPSNTSGPTHPPVIKSNFPTFFFPTNFLE